VAKVLLADQLSRPCFRGTAEAFSYNQIARQLVRDLVSAEEIDATLKLRAHAALEQENRKLRIPLSASPSHPR
jgi:uncharacterized protein (DUF924 family)